MKKKWYALCVLLCVAVMALFGLTACKDEQQVITVDDLQITISKDFVEKEYLNFTKSYETAEMAVCIIKETFSDLNRYGYSASTMTRVGYAEAVQKVNKKTYNYATQVEKKDDLVTFTYESDAVGKDYKFLWVGYKLSQRYTP